jgi:hypothetical protein
LPLSKTLSILSAFFVGAAAASCAPRADVPPAASLPPRASIEAHALVLAALDCVMAPVVDGAPPWASNDVEVATFGPEASSCATAARAAHVGSARLYRVDSDALINLRHAIRRGEPGTQPSRDPIDMLALFDHGLAAVMEARRARTALVREAPRPSPQAVDKIRARALVVELDDFGRRRGGEMGLEARAVARVIAASGFLQVGRVETPARPWVAEPLFTMMFGSEFLSESAGEPAAPWGDYVAAAARASRTNGRATAVAETEAGGASRKAVGGGPVEDARRDLRAVADAAATDLRSLATSLPAGSLRGALERTVENLRAFDVESAASEL